MYLLGPRTTNRQLGIGVLAMSEEIIDLRKLFKIIGAYKWVIITSVLVFLGGAVAVTITTPPTYETSFSIVVGPKMVQPPVFELGNLSSEAPSSQVDESRAMLNYQKDTLKYQQAYLKYQTAYLDYQIASSYQNLLSNERFFNTFAQALQGPATVSLAMKEASLTDGSYSVKATPTQLTQYIQVSVTGDDPEKIGRLATAIGKISPYIFKKVIGGSSSDTSKDIGPLFNVSVIDPATTPTQPIQPKLPVTAGLMSFVGLMVGLGIAFLLNYLKTDN